MDDRIVLVVVIAIIIVFTIIGIKRGWITRPKSGFTAMTVYHDWSTKDTQESVEVIMERNAGKKEQEQFSGDPDFKDRPRHDTDDDSGAWIKKLTAKGVKVEGKKLSKTKLVNIVADLIEPKADSGKPVFVTDYFTELCPLAKTKKDNPAISERFELYIAGIEIANAYSELNDPIEQKQVINRRSEFYFISKNHPVR